MFEKHVFVFRHCLRSTQSSVNLHNGENGGNGENVSVPVSALWTVPGSDADANEPPWNVPLEWCTEQGIAISRRTGQWLAKTFIQNQQTVVRILSDTSQRDVDTALAVSEGLRDEGIHAQLIELTPDLFQPVQPQQQQQQQSTCPPIDKSIVLTQMQERLDHVPPPTNVPEALQLINSLVRLTHHYSNTTTALVPNINGDDLHLKGPVNIIKLLAQMILYSRASNLDFLPHATPLQISTLIPWIAWQRTIEDAFHSQAAQQGAVLATFIVTMLRQSYQQPQRPIIILIFGHDSNLNQLQTVLNVEWSLPMYGTHSPTPPGTALYWHQDSDGQIALELLFPNYLTMDGTTNTSGILDRKPLLSFLHVNEMSQYIQTQLAQYEGASPCFHPESTTSIINDVPIKLYYGIFAALLLVLLVPVTLCVVQKWGKSCRRRHDGNTRNHPHNTVTYTVADLELA